MGVCIAANKIPGIRAAVAENIAAAVNSKSVNNSNVLALGAMITTPEEAKEIVLAWLNAEFKGPAPANKGEGWLEEIQEFLKKSMPAPANKGEGWSEEIQEFLKKSMPAFAELDGTHGKEQEQEQQEQEQEQAQKQQQQKETAALPVPYKQAFPSIPSRPSLASREQNGFCSEKTLRGR